MWYTYILTVLQNALQWLVKIWHLATAYILADPFIKMLSRLARAQAIKTSLRAPIYRSSAIRFYSDDSLSYDEFTSKYEKEFDGAYDTYEVQRILNNVFSYDLVPAPTVIERALLAARRVNDYATASRVFEALKHKVDSEAQYKAYLDELKETREELGVTLQEDLFKEEEK